MAHDSTEHDQTTSQRAQQDVQPQRAQRDEEPERADFAATPPEPAQPHEEPEPADPAPSSPEPAQPVDELDETAALRTQVVDLTNDLKRLQAEYVNYKRRVDRDRDLSRTAGIEQVVADLLPVLDNLRTARQHEELTGGFKLFAEEIEKVAGRHGLESYGEKDDPFDPQIHDALMQASMPGITEPTCIDVMQVGYRLNGRVIRPARVAVALPGDSD